MGNLDKKAKEIKRELREVVQSNEFDPDHKKDLVYDVFIGNVPIGELAEKSVDIEFEHSDGPGTLYQLEETVNSVLTEWVENALPEEFSEYQTYIFNKYWDDVLGLAENKYRKRKD